jgi:hypothetical protein
MSFSFLKLILTIPLFEINFETFKMLKVFKHQQLKFIYFIRKHIALPLRSPTSLEHQFICLHLF